MILPPEIINEILDRVPRFHLPIVAQVCHDWLHYTMSEVKSITNETDFFEACKISDVLSIMKSFFNIYEHMNDGLRIVCEHGHTELALLLIKKFAPLETTYSDAFNKSLFNIIYYNTGRDDFAKTYTLLTEEHLRHPKNYLNAGLRGAYQGGWSKLAEMLTYLGAKK